MWHVSPVSFLKKNPLWMQVALSGRHQPLERLRLFKPLLSYTTKLHLKLTRTTKPELNIREPLKQWHDNVICRQHHRHEAWGNIGKLTETALFQLNKWKRDKYNDFSFLHVFFSYPSMLCKTQPSLQSSLFLNKLTRCCFNSSNITPDTDHPTWTFSLG